MDKKSYRLGGIVLLLAALVGVVGGFLHPPQPGTLDAFAELGTQWTVSHVAIGMTGTLLAISALFLARHFAGTAGEGWALVGSGALLLAGVAILAVGALETAGFSALLAADSGAAAEHAFLATSSVMGSMFAAARLLGPVAITAYGLGMLKDQGWPMWLAWLGVVIGVALLAVNVFGISLGPASNLFGYLSNVWYAIVGTIFMGKGTAAATADATVIL
jgi:hypothetical protein